MLIFALLPLIAFLVLLLIIYSKITVEGAYTKLRIAIVYTILFHQTVLVLITELLSVFAWLSFTPLALSWSLFIVLLIMYCRIAQIRFTTLREIFSVSIQSIRLNLTGYLIACIVLGSFVVGLLYPPNNYDSMTYHLARVAHWVQNKSVGLYASHIMRQLDMQPLSEYDLLHAQILTAGDRLANSMQLFYYMGCIVMVTLVTQALGGNRKVQLLSALFCALIPMVLLQSNSTQNDIVGGFFVLAFAWFTIRLMKEIRPILLIGAGLSLGLGWLTKGTVYIFTLPFIGWLLVNAITQWKFSFRQFFQRSLQFAVIALVALLLNSILYYRNFTMTGSIFGNSGDITKNKMIGVKPFLIIVTKNFLNHIPVKDAPAKLAAIGSRFNLDMEDPRYNFAPTSFMMDRFFYHEDYVQNYVHTILIALFCIVFLVRTRCFTRQRGLFNWYVLSLMLSAIVFCLYLRWQPWGNRLESPLFMLFAVFLAFEIGRAHILFRAVIVAVMLWYSAVAFLYNVRHPVMPLRENILTKGYDHFLFATPFFEIQHWLHDKPYTKIGLVIELDHWDYPYYKLLSNTNGKKRVIEHLLVTNESARYAKPFVPELIISTNKKKPSYAIGQQEYVRSVQFSDSSAIYLPRPR